MVRSTPRSHQYFRGGNYIGYEYPEAAITDTVLELISQPHDLLWVVVLRDAVTKSRSLDQRKNHWLGSTLTAPYGIVGSPVLEC